MPISLETDGLPRYDWTRSYRWNYENVPMPSETLVAAFPGVWDYCGRNVDSPLGIPAGPLLNGKWCLYYASLGFDVLTYKTVRSKQFPCYEMPNLQPVAGEPLDRSGQTVMARTEMERTWAVSFGMPSAAPETWRRDVEQTRRSLNPRKLLSVSVVGTVQPGWEIDDLADDYARCARWAVESGADAIEMNFSCPNVSTSDGQLYQAPKSARTVASRVRQCIGETPLVVKIGHLSDDSLAADLIGSVNGIADGLAMTNSIAAAVTSSGGDPFFDGQLRGICGEAIRAESTAQVARFSRLIAACASNLAIVAVGGISDADHISQYQKAGASAFHLATAAMLDPSVGRRIRRKIAARQNRDGNY